MFASLRRTIRRMKYGEPIYVVSGLPRSGTSMAMKMLEAGGLDVVTDGNRMADEDNPKGYYEDDRVLNLAEDVDKAWLGESRGKVVKIISYLLSYLPKENNYKIIFMRRNIEEVLASQQKMLERRGEEDETTDEKMLENYRDHLLLIDRRLRDTQNWAHLEAVNIDYKEAVGEPRKAAEKINAFVGGHLDVDKMAAVVDAKLYRNRK